MVIHPIAVEVFQSGKKKWWNDQAKPDAVIHGFTLLAWENIAAWH